MRKLFINFLSLVLIFSNGHIVNGNNEWNPCWITTICSNLSRWNAAIPLTGNLVSDVCDIMVKLECPALETNSSSISYSITLLLSTISEEISPADNEMLSRDQFLPGTVELYHQDVTTINGTLSKSFDLRNTFLDIPSDTCGQMFFVATLWASYGDSNGHLVSSKAWPFQVICETEVDLALYVGLKSHSLKNGILGNNLTILVGVPLFQQFNDLKVYLANRNESQSLFFRRSNPSLPKITVYVTPQKHALLTKGYISYSQLQNRLEDAMLHPEDALINLEVDKSSSVIEPGQMLLLNSSHLILTSTTNCGEALLVFRLDLDDLNVENNYVIIPIFVDCWALPEFMGSSSKACGVIPDEFSMGNAAVMYTTLQPHGNTFVYAYLYKADDKTFQPIRNSNLLMVAERIKTFRAVQLERDRLLKTKQCPTNIELKLPFNDTLFGQLYDFLVTINDRWIPLNESENMMTQQEQIKLIGQGFATLLIASTTYNSVPAYFVDSVLNGLYSYWPFFPFEIPSAQMYTESGLIGNSSRQSWHDRLAKTVSHFMRGNIYADYDGKIDPDAGLQNFLNQLLWNPDSLESASLSKNAILQLRKLLVMVLEKKLPRTFDHVPVEILNSLSIFSEDFTSPLPIKEETLKNVLEVAMSTIQSYLKNASYLSQAKEINKSSKTGDLESSLKILSSMFVAVNTSANIRRLTLIIQKIQESVSLNKQWVMIDGVSDTTIDAELYCRLRAVSRINFRQNSEAEDVFKKLSWIIFWKKDSGVIYRGDISGITGRLYWNRVAVCHCDEFSSTKYQTNGVTP